MEEKYKTIIIGGGVSGIFAAVYAARGGCVLVLERNNDPCKKIYATGNGRCNYLNTNAPSSRELVCELKKIGISPAQEEDGRLYPLCREAAFVAQALTLAAEKSGAKIQTDSHVTDVLYTGQGYMVVLKDGRKYFCDNLVIATGGKAGIQFGCYGEGYRWAQFLGHKIVKPIPALVPLDPEANVSPLAGVRVRGSVSLLKNNETAAQDRGEIQFTKDSISGICVMNISRNLRLSDGESYSLCIDLFPDKTQEELSSELSERKRAFGSMLSGLLPKKLAEYIENAAKTPEAAAALCKKLCFALRGTKGWADAQVTSGGIELSELDPSTMESLKHPGLYFVGEINDYDGPCGGYNLGYAFLSGMLAGKAIADRG